jgi:hypothetical protein
MEMLKSSTRASERIGLRILRTGLGHRYQTGKMNCFIICIRANCLELILKPDLVEQSTIRLRHFFKRACYFEPFTQICPSLNIGNRLVLPN